MKTIEECKQEISVQYSCDDFDELLWKMADGEGSDGLDWFSKVTTEVSELYASQFISTSDKTENLEIKGHMTREEIKEKIKYNNSLIDKLDSENTELKRQSYLLSDEKQWYTEALEPVTGSRGRGIEAVKELVGRIYWNEEFVDEDGGPSVFIKCSRVVRVNGEWID